MKRKTFSMAACVVTGAFLIFLVSSQFSRAQNPASQPTLEQQLKETEAGFRKSDAAMNELYQKVLSSRSSNEQQEFKNAQRAWVKSRNHSTATAETTTESHVSTLADHEVAIPDAQAGDDILIFRYLKQKTEDRIEELKNYISPKVEHSTAEFEKIGDKSPDGKFAMLISCSSEPRDPNNIDSDLITAAELVSLPSKNSVIKSLQNYSGSVPDLIWSKDSNWLAYSLSSGPRVTDTYVYHRSGEDFIQLQTDDLRVAVEGDVRNEYVKAIRWLEPGVLLLEQFDIFRGGEGKDATYRFTARFDTKTGKLQIISKKKVRSTAPH
jgi:uncharacterized protein YecT (DUF1311 family)